MFQDIFVHFGIPREIVKDGGPWFTSHLIKKLVEKYGNHHKITTPYHPQENGQVESTNKFIEGIFTKTVASHQRNWAEKLPEVLWAYRTTWRNTIGFSPHELVYGNNPLFPVKIEINTLRTVLQVDLDLSTTQTQRLNQINELEEKWLAAIQQTKII